MGFILYIIAKILYSILRVVTIPYAVIRLIRFKKHKYFIYVFDFKLVFNYFHQLALGFDKLGNVMIAPAANDFMIKKTAKKLYGNGDETISHVTGVNYLHEDLTSFGYFVAHTLDTVEKNHVENAANYEK